MKRFLIVAAIVALLLLGGCITKNPKPQPPTQPQGPPPEQPIVVDANESFANEMNTTIKACEALPNRLDAEACLAKAAKEKLSAIPCGRLTLFSKDECLLPVAAGTKDRALCERMTGRGVKNLCLKEVGIGQSSVPICTAIINDAALLDQCVNTIARSLLSADACQSLTTPLQRDACTLYIAQQKIDMSLCTRISDASNDGTYTRDRCYSATDANHTGETCFNFISQAEMQKCFMAATTKPKNAQGCSSLADKVSKDTCNYWAGTRTPEPNYCYTLDAELSKKCLDYILANRLAIDACFDIRNYVEKNKCISKAAVDANSNEYCEIITSDMAIHDDCISKVAQKKLDENICLKITRNNVDAIDDCISAVALATKQAEKCELVKGDSEYYTCYSAIAMGYKSIDICKLAKRTQFKILPYPGTDYCYNDYALRMKEEPACEGISVPDLRNQCHCTFSDGEICGASQACPKERNIAGKGDQCCKKPATGSYCIFIGT